VSLVSWSLSVSQVAFLQNLGVRQVLSRRRGRGDEGLRAEGRGQRAEGRGEQRDGQAVWRCLCGGGGEGEREGDLT